MAWTSSKLSPRRLRLISVLASIALALTLTARAVLSPNFPWDAWAYHLPFAAYIWNIGGGEQHFILSRGLHNCYLGYPKLAESLQGLAWVLAGSLRGTITPNIIILGLFLAHVRAHLRLDLAYVLPAMFAFPLVTLHYQSTYIDFFTAMALGLEVSAAFALLRLRALKPTAPVRRAWMANVLVLCGGAVAASESKLTATPVALVILAWVFFKTAAGMKGKPSTPVQKLCLILMVLCVPVACGQYLSNAWQFSNPFFPKMLSGADIVEGTSLDRHSTLPPYLHLGMLNWPLSFITSVTEIDWLLRGIPPFHYNVHMDIGDQNEMWTRTGGLFGPYVMLHLSGFAFLAWRVMHSGSVWQRRRGRETITLFGIITLVIAFLPGTHELRYYLIWPIALILCNGLLLRLVRPRWQAMVPIAMSVLCALQIGLLDLYPRPFALHYDDLSREALRARTPPDLLRQLSGTTGKICMEDERLRQFRYSSAVIGGDHVIKQQPLQSSCHGTTIKN